MRQSQHRRRQTKMKRWAWAVTGGLVVFLLFIFSLVLQPPRAKAPAASGRPPVTHTISAKEHRVKEEKRSASSSSALTSRFTNDTYSTPTLTVKLTGARIVTDKGGHPALFIQYDITNNGATTITPATIWRQYALIRQGAADAKKSQITPLTEATLTDKDAKGNLGKLITVSQTPLAPNKKASGAMVYTFVNKDPIRLQFIDRDTGRPLGTKTYEITG
ncbi:DUF5067 domain-containing protein [Schleiferilactobacillus shenzhenensis]|nr:DUF5067 domain-containing protein [Schleiferilactobacillus shenzhenensis]